MVSILPHPFILTPLRNLIISGQSANQPNLEFPLFPLPDQTNNKIMCAADDGSAAFKQGWIFNLFNCLFLARHFWSSTDQQSGRTEWKSSVQFQIFGKFSRRNLLTNSFKFIIICWAMQFNEYFLKKWCFYHSRNLAFYDYNIATYFIGHRDSKGEHFEKAKLSNAVLFSLLHTMQCEFPDTDTYSTVLHSMYFYSLPYSEKKSGMDFSLGTELKLLCRIMFCKIHG